MSSRFFSPSSAGRVESPADETWIGMRRPVVDERTPSPAASGARRGFWRARSRPADLRRALRGVAFPSFGGGLATIQSVIFLPRRQSAEVAIGKLPATAGRYFTVRLPSGEGAKSIDRSRCIHSIVSIAS